MSATSLCDDPAARTVWRHSGRARRVTQARTAGADGIPGVYLPDMYALGGNEGEQVAAIAGILYKSEPHRPGPSMPWLAWSSVMA
jgi:hypothetical protein